ncbi:MAG: class C sortase, partial [Anaerococcus sp.]|nr:class C sortase [Anaerococcus sp.]
MKKNIKKKKSKKSNLLWKLIFLIGIVILLYPIISRFYYKIDSNNQVEVFNEGKSKLEKEEIQRRIGLAKAYNDSLSGGPTTDPFTKKRREEGRKEYARMLEVEEMIGH